MMLTSDMSMRQSVMGSQTRKPGVLSWYSSSLASSVELHDGSASLSS